MQPSRNTHPPVTEPSGIPGHAAETPHEATSAAASALLGLMATGVPEQEALALLTAEMGMGTLAPLWGTWFKSGGSALEAIRACHRISPATAEALATTDLAYAYVESEIVDGFWLPTDQIDSPHTFTEEGMTGLRDLVHAAPDAALRVAHHLRDLSPAKDVTALGGTDDGAHGFAFDVTPWLRKATPMALLDAIENEWSHCPATDAILCEQYDRGNPEAKALFDYITAKGKAGELVCYACSISYDVAEYWIATERPDLLPLIALPEDAHERQAILARLVPGEQP